MRLIHAPRVFGEIVARERKRARSRSAADLLVLAEAALPAALGRIPQRLEQLGVAVYVRQRIVENVAAGHGQKTAREDLARVRYEYEPLAVADARRPPCHPFGVLVRRDTVLRFDSLRDVAPVV